MRGYHVYKDGTPVRDEILACQCEKGNAHDPFSINVAVLQLAITSSTYLFARLIAVGGTSCDSGLSTCADNKDALNT